MEGEVVDGGAAGEEPDVEVAAGLEPVVPEVLRLLGCVVRDERDARVGPGGEAAGAAPCVFGVDLVGHAAL